MTATITSTAIDAFVAIGYVRVVDRHRNDLGDLSPLAKSIEDVGLLNPLTLTRDGRLVCGERRLKACRLLGWTEVPVRFADNLGDALALLRAEMAENLHRKDMTPEELVRLGRRMEELERPVAAARQGTRVDLGQELSFRTEGKSKADLETATAVGDALGIGRTRYYMAKAIISHAEDESAPAHLRETAEAARVEMNATGHITPAYEKVKAALREPPPAPPRPVVKDNDWVPKPAERGRGAAFRRREILREMAPLGYTSEQIGARLGILPETVRRLARENGITIPADEVFVGTRHSIDSNRIVRETIQHLADAEMALDLVDFDALDRDEIGGWVTSLSTSIRRLTRLNKQLKEMTQ